MHPATDGELLQGAQEPGVDQDLGVDQDIGPLVFADDSQVAPIQNDRPLPATGAAAAQRRLQRLHRMLREARSAIESRDELISMLSHDLRSPLAIIQLHIQGLLRHGGGADVPDWMAQRLRKADQVATHALKLLTDLLDNSMRTGQSTAVRDEVELAEFIEEVLSLYREQLAAAGCQARVQCEGKVPGRWDRVFLFQIVSNLICNAIKYAAGHPIEIRIARHRRRVRLEFCDQGGGIPFSRHQRVFDRFERCASGEDMKGYGLGLWIVRSAVGKLGGSIRLQSDSGSGSTFIIDLPT